MMSVYLEGHRSTMGWWDGHGFHAACECGFETGGCPGTARSARNTAEARLAEHFASVEDRSVTVIEQDAVELPDDEFPEGF